MQTNSNNPTQTITGYLVTNAQQPQTAAFFTDPKLLQARRMALDYVEQRTAADSLSDIALAYEIQLVEANPQTPLTHYQPIALIHQQELAAQKATPSPERQTRCQHGMEELHQEYLYYLANQQSMGLGFFRLACYDPGEDVASLQLSILADAMAYSCILDSGLNLSSFTPDLPERNTITTFYPAYLTSNTQ
ncbi:hypothetical protein IC229_24325 [Spirosoma sp. BT702]|uniref:Uncharacterized protein n=1 Tax=Spirosoma profusum TaxID=2771354 RepID=A0A926Y0S9_9BACT|nr:hypothetical protein [Spirosoma profusum]MBD2703795.1 hypothetical protein [Spirosoma profusum]